MGQLIQVQPACVVLDGADATILLHESSVKTQLTNLGSRIAASRLRSYIFALALGSRSLFNWEHAVSSLQQAVNHRITNAFILHTLRRLGLEHRRAQARSMAADKRQVRHCSLFNRIDRLDSLTTQLTTWLVRGQHTIHKVRIRLKTEWETVRILTTHKADLGVRNRLQDGTRCRQKVITGIKEIRCFDRGLLVIELKECQQEYNFLNAVKHRCGRHQEQLNTLRLLNDTLEIRCQEFARLRVLHLSRSTRCIQILIRCRQAGITKIMGLVHHEETVSKFLLEHRSLTNLLGLIIACLRHTLQNIANLVGKLNLAKEGLTALNGTLHTLLNQIHIALKKAACKAELRIACALVRGIRLIAHADLDTFNVKNRPLEARLNIRRRHNKHLAARLHIQIRFAALNSCTRLTHTNSVIQQHTAIRSSGVHKIRNETLYRCHFKIKTAATRIFIRILPTHRVSLFRFL